MFCGKGSKDKLEKNLREGVTASILDYSSLNKDLLAKANETTIFTQSVRTFAHSAILILIL